MAGTPPRFTLFPSTALLRSSVKSVGASLKLKVTVAVLAATLTSLLLTATEAVGVTVSTTKAVLVEPVPRLPLASCQVLSTLTEPLAMSVPAAAVKVAGGWGERRGGEEGRFPWSPEV